jgi:hypothetical protein
MLQVSELMLWDDLLVPIGGPAIDPLAHTSWADLPLKARVAILFALVRL